MSGQGSAGNVVAAIASFFFPGLGQLVQGRLGAAILFFCIWLVLGWFLWVVGWFIASIIAALDAAKYQPKQH